MPDPIEMPQFNHPDVQAVLLENMEIVTEAGLQTAFMDNRSRHILQCKDAQRMDGTSRQSTIDAMKTAMYSELQFAGYKSTVQYEAPETSLYLVKVTPIGEVAAGSLARVTVYDEMSGAALKLEDDFTIDHFEAIRRIVANQTAINWQPVLNLATYGS